MYSRNATNQSRLRSPMASDGFGIHVHGRDSLSMFYTSLLATILSLLPVYIALVFLYTSNPSEGYAVSMVAAP